MKKVLLFLFLMASLALVACGSKNEDGNGGDVPPMSSKDLPAEEIPDKAGFTKSGYVVEGTYNGKPFSINYYIYKNSDNKIEYFTIGGGSDSSYDYKVTYSGDTATRIDSTPAIYDNPVTDQPRINRVLQKLENKEQVSPQLDNLDN